MIPEEERLPDDHGLGDCERVQLQVAEHIAFVWDLVAFFPPPPLSSSLEGKIHFCESHGTPACGEGGELFNLPYAKVHLVCELRRRLREETIRMHTYKQILIEKLGVATLISFFLK